MYGEPGLYFSTFIMHFTEVAVDFTFKFTCCVLLHHRQVFLSMQYSSRDGKHLYYLWKWLILT